MSQKEGRISEVMVMKPPGFRYRAFVSWDTESDHAQDKMHVVHVDPDDSRSEEELMDYAEELASVYGDG